MGIKLSGINNTVVAFLNDLQNASYIGGVKNKGKDLILHSDFNLLRSDQIESSLWTKTDSKKGKNRGLLLLLADEDLPLSISRSFGTRNLKIENGRFVLQVYTPFRSGKHVKYFTTVKADDSTSRAYNNSKQKADELWYTRTVDFEQIVRLFTKYDKKHFENTIKSMEEAFANEGLSVEQNEYIFGLFSENEFFFRKVLLHSNLITRLPLDYLRERASDHNIQFSKLCDSHFVLKSDGSNRNILLILWRSFSEGRKERIKYFKPKIYEYLESLSKNEQPRQDYEFWWGGSPHDIANATRLTDEQIYHLTESETLQKDIKQEIPKADKVQKKRQSIKAKK